MYVDVKEVMNVVNGDKRISNPNYNMNKSIIMIIEIQSFGLFG